MFSETMAWDLITRDITASRGFHGLEDAVEDAGDAMDQTSAKADGLTKQTGKLVEKQSELDKAIAETRARMVELGHEFERTGDMDVFKALRKDRGDLRRLESMRKTLQQIQELGKVDSRGAGPGIADALGSLPAQLKGAGIVAAAGLGVAMTPVLGAAIAGAVLGGAGAGGVLGGVIAAAQDERVKDAGGVLGTNFMAGFKDAGRSLINPILDQMGQLQRTEDIFLADLASGFATLAPAVGPIVDGLEGLAENLDLDEVFKDSLPVIRAIANELPEFGDAISDAFEAMGDESDGAVMGITALIRATGSLIRTGGDVIAYFAGYYEWITRNTAATSQWALDMIDIAQSIPGLTGALGGPQLDVARGRIQSLHDASQGLIDGLDDAIDTGDDWRGNLADQAEGTREAEERTKAYVDALNDLFDVQMNLEEAQINLRQGQRELIKDLEDGKRTLKENTEEGDKNREAILRQVKVIEAVRDANIANGMAVDEANEASDDQLRALEKMIVELGFNKQAVHDVIAAWIEFKRKAVVEPQVEDKQVLAAINKVRILDQEMDRLNGNVATVHVRTIFGEFRAGERNPSGRAGGGGVDAGPSYWVGEHGPEIVRFSRSGHVIPAGDSRAMAADAAVQRVEIALTVRPAPNASRQVMDSIVEGLQYDVETVGGGSVTVLLEKPR